MKSDFTIILGESFMGTIKDQPINLGLVDNKKEDLECSFVNHCEKLDFNHQVLMKLIDLIVTRKPISEVHSYLTGQKLRFQSANRKK